ncbi:CidA/LrgA family protein [Alicyclobacillus cycloheptanicus]|uniref:Holin-like protein n=1 Tax=Alicyclobacillus cycloheptanicus TaxID=1457 RepID=A0ABT9XHI7_9BACL|nr:CidA/LrgA family protein [Alicyclobacillus cycloheptanicus]MDQ0189196.1 holin-like protein [Alicyclobacillus cycloheptanicus]WDM00382.1 CidA/LrgA family protein [Alicyclobacillus cycloheptanicus]
MTEDKHPARPAHNDTPRPWHRVVSGVLIVVQVAFLWAISLAADAVAKWLHCPIPGSILGFVALFLLLKFKVVKLSWVEKGGDFLLANLLLFFIPSAVGIIQYGHLVRVDGIRLVGLILISIVLVMGWTGWVAERLTNRQRKSKSPAPLPASHVAGGETK